MRVPNDKLYEMYTKWARRFKQLGLKVPTKYDVRFAFIYDRDAFGYAHDDGDDGFLIELSVPMLTSVNLIDQTIGHELIHIHRALTGDSKWDKHDERFDDICRLIYSAYSIDVA
jgi:hypothetical protein